MPVDHGLQVEFHDQVELHCQWKLQVEVELQVQQVEVERHNIFQSRLPLALVVLHSCASVCDDSQAATASTTVFTKFSYM